MQTDRQAGNIYHATVQLTPVMTYPISHRRINLPINQNEMVESPRNTKYSQASTCTHTPQHDGWRDESWQLTPPSWVSYKKGERSPCCVLRRSRIWPDISLWGARNVVGFDLPLSALWCVPDSGDFSKASTTNTLMGFHTFGLDFLKCFCFLFS